MRNSMYLGIADIKYINKQDITGLPNQVRYYNTGRYYAEATNLGTFGKGFKIGETVIVEVDWQMATVSWRVDGQLRH